MAEERDTKSFKISGNLLGYLLAVLLGASGGAGVGSLRQAESAPAINTSQFVTREEAAKSSGETRERLARIESKLDQLTEAEAARRRR